MTFVHAKSSSALTLDSLAYYRDDIDNLKTLKMHSGDDENGWMLKIHLLVKSLLGFIHNTRHFVCNGRVETEILYSLSVSYLKGRDDSCVV